MCCSEIVALPKTDQHGNLIMVAHLVDENASKFSFDDCLKAWFMIQDMILLEHGAVPGIIFIADTKGFTMGHIARINLSSLKKYYMYIQVLCAE
jgi:hypothetical protein